MDFLLPSVTRLQPCWGTHLELFSANGLDYFFEFGTYTMDFVRQELACYRAVQVPFVHFPWNLDSSLVGQALSNRPTHVSTENGQLEPGQLL